MGIVRGLLDRLVLLAGVLAAACIPSFIVQYRQRAGGRLDQVLADLAPFQQIANRDFGGSLANLIHYHLQSGDPTFHGEGAALQGMVDAAAQLRATVQALNSDLIHQCLYLVRQPDLVLLRTTWNSYEPAFTFSVQAALFALSVGVFLWLLFLGLWHGTAGVARRARRSRQHSDRMAA